MRTAIISMGKLSSRRLTHKLLRPLGSTTVIEHHLRLIRQIEADSHFFATRDPCLSKIAEGMGINVIRRPQCSTTGKTFFDVWGPMAVAAIEDFEVIIWVNACCPFVDPDRVYEAAEDFSGELIVPVRKIETPYWDIDGESLSDRGAINTQAANACYALSHSFWIRSPDMVLETRDNDKYVEQHRNAILVEVSAIEDLDIDTDDDYQIANAYFTNLFGGGTSRTFRSESPGTHQEGE